MELECSPILNFFKIKEEKRERFYHLNGYYPYQSPSMKSNQTYWEIPGYTMLWASSWDGKEPGDVAKAREKLMKEEDENFETVLKKSRITCYGEGRVTKITEETTPYRKHEYWRIFIVVTDEWEHSELGNLQKIGEIIEYLVPKGAQLLVKPGDILRSGHILGVVDGEAPF